ncbi:MAG: methyltransferase [Candidatus Diapherotrites archaeon]|nr:methyltransferase [Candidatus Diapherotrites archaeon]
MIAPCNGVYKPEDDSYMLLDALLSLPLAGKRVLDMGTGTGILAVNAALRGAHVTAVDINPLALDCTRRNAEAEGVWVRTIQSDLFERVDGTYDIITFNPPYLPGTESDPDYDPAWSGGKDGRAVLDRFLVQFPNYLEKDGVLLLVQSSLNDPEKTDAILSDLGFVTRRISERRYFYETLWVLEASRCP